MNRLTVADAQLRFPQFCQPNLSRENYAKDFYGDDYYLNASGFSSETGSALIKQVEAQVIVVNDLRKAYDKAVSTKKLALANRDNGYCLNKFPKNRDKTKRQACQSDTNRIADLRTSEAETALTALRNGQKMLTDLQNRLSSDNEAIRVLASQGKTPESVSADAIAKANMKKWYIVGGVFVVVALVGLMVAKRVN